MKKRPEWEDILASRSQRRLVGSDCICGQDCPSVEALKMHYNLGHFDVDIIATFMTDAQTDHSERIRKEFIDIQSPKYATGVREHGGNLWEKSPIWLITEAMNETVDQFTYLQTAKDNLLKIRELIHEAFNDIAAANGVTALSLDEMEAYVIKRLGLN
jgi:hypothetical protein